MQCLPLLRVVVQWSQPLNYSPARSTSSSHLIIMPLISCSNWSLPLKYDSTIWSFIKKLFFWNCWERFCVLKKACSMFCWRRLRRNKRRKKRGGKEETSGSHYHSFLCRGAWGGPRTPASPARTAGPAPAVHFTEQWAALAEGPWDGARAGDPPPPLSDTAPACLCMNTTEQTS